MPADPHNRREKSSLSNAQDVRVTHMDLALAVRFGERAIAGTATYTATVLEDGATELVLDTNGLEIKGASFDGTATTFTLAEEVAPFGRALHVPFPAPQAKGTVITAAVQYETTAASAALQWLTPAQTTGKSHPFVFTQCQAIHARTLVPCQDAPAIKVTYTARVSVPAPLKAVMSALSSEEGPVDDEALPGNRIFSFRQPVPLSTYLMALAAGNLDSRELGPRTRVWAEPEVVEKAAWEFAETDDFVKAGEDLLGPYVWGRYDILVMPSSYPYGGMENSNMTFLTPTLLAGDRSLVNVVAHEAAHSWTGNLVGPATNEAFFLNEAFTVMSERKMTAAVRRQPGLYDFDAVSGEKAMADSIATFLERGQPEFTKLVPDLTGIDPDDSFSSVPYEKGFYLLKYLENLVTPPLWHRFLHDYMQTFKFRAITPADFRDYCVAYFTEGRHALPPVSHRGAPIHNGIDGPFDPADIPVLAAAPVVAVPDPGVSAEEAAAAKAQATAAAAIATVDWDAWFFGVGMPPVKITYNSAAREAVEAHAAAWVFDTPAAMAAAASTTAAWGPAEWVAFMERLEEIARELASRPAEDGGPAVVHPDVVRALGAAFGFPKSRNSEIRFSWCFLCIKSGVEEELPGALDFLRSQGRMKYVRPLMSELLRTAVGRPLALDLYESHGAASYHPICAKMVAHDINVVTAKPAVDTAALPRVGTPPPAGPASETTAATEAATGTASAGAAEGSAADHSSASTSTAGAPAAGAEEEVIEEFSTADAAGESEKVLELGGGEDEDDEDGEGGMSAKQMAMLEEAMAAMMGAAGGEGGDAAQQANLEALLQAMMASAMGTEAGGEGGDEEDEDDDEEGWETASDEDEGDDEGTEAPATSTSSKKGKRGGFGGYPSKKGGKTPKGGASTASASGGSAASAAKETAVAAPKAPAPAPAPAAPAVDEVTLRARRAELEAVAAAGKAGARDAARAVVAKRHGKAGAAEEEEEEAMEDGAAGGAGAFLASTATAVASKVGEVEVGAATGSWLAPAMAAAVVGSLLVGAIVYLRRK